ncbi:hypothetical protein AAFF_G00005820 [Aldrovandia affinis]|uniref:RING-type domain-containing protein n=1 Tax=Aldrovandia affinis TaxID=143900 RepID=A0AAD7X426_9TELE|nr:hypothetical protein AAFF_G00005820 [Aldrovandia affinis]
MENEMVVNSLHAGIVLPGEMETESRDGEHQKALCFTLDQLSLGAVEKADCVAVGGLADSLDTPDSNSDTCNGIGGFVGLQMLEHSGGSAGSPTSCSPPPEYYGSGGFHMTAPHTHAVLGEPSSVLCSRKRSVNMTECVPVPSSEHVAEIVGRQGCKIKALRAKTNTYIKTPVRGEEPVFIVTGRREDVEMAKHEILSAAEHFSMIRASRCKAGATGAVPGAGGALPAPPHLPGQTTIQVRVPYRVVGLVVGPKGATVKRIQQQTHTYIVTPSRDKDPVFEVTGMPENVDRAREEIETHITLRTGAFVDLQGDNDFHSNGTDVSLEGLGVLGAWSRASHSAPPRPQPLPMSLHHPGRKARSASFHSGGLGSGPPESSSPGSPFSTGSAGGGFAFGGDLPAPPAEELGFELSSANIWAPFAGPEQQQQQPRRNSGGMSAGAVTPRVSPTLPSDPAGLEHPLARRAQSDPLSALSWLQTGSASFSRGSSSSSGGSTTGYSSSCSASSLPGGSPTESEGGGSTAGMLARFKAAGLAVGLGAGARDCYVCFESEVTAALVPCGHNLFCMDCAGQICQSAEPECPVCQTPATQCIRIFS